MANVDNKTYRNQYHFNNKWTSTPDELSSVKGPKEINSTIRENPKGGNVEIEGKEIVLNPDLMGIFKAQGKRHAQGGMEVNLKPDSFVFSDFRKLKFTPNEKKFLDLKETKKSSTPSKTVQENVDLKHYNRVLSNLQNPDLDNVALQSSALMLQNYVDKLGKIAFLQEKKKDFPDGLPDFSAGTAPVFNPEVKQDMERTKQFAKQGGKIKMQTGGSFNWMNLLRPQQSITQPKDPIIEMFKNNPSQGSRVENLSMNGFGPYSRQEQRRLPWGSNQRLNEWQTNAASFGYTGNNNIGNLQDFTSTTFPGIVNDAYSQNYLRINNKGVNKGYNVVGSQNTQAQNIDQFKDNMWGVDRVMAEYRDFNTQDEMDEWLKDKRSVPTGNESNPMAYLNPNQNVSMSDFLTYYIPRIKNQRQLQLVGAESSIPNIESLGTLTPTFDRNPVTGTTVTPPIRENDVEGDNGINTDWSFTPWQRLSQAFNWGQYATAKRYMPYRSRFESTYMTPSLVNPEQTIADTQASANQSINSLSTLSPILRNAQANSVTGQLMNTIPGIRSQYDNQNAQIINQARQFNTQLRNQESQINMNNDQQYYQQAVQARANFDNMRNYLANQAMSNTLKDVSTNQSLAFELAAMDNPAYTFDFRSGQIKRLPKNILDVNETTKGDMMSQYLGRVAGDWEKLSSKEKIDLLKVMTARGFSIKKSGGKIK